MGCAVELGRGSNSWNAIRRRPGKGGRWPKPKSLLNYAVKWAPTSLCLLPGAGCAYDVHPSMTAPPTTLSADPCPISPFFFFFFDLGRTVNRSHSQQIFHLGPHAVTSHAGGGLQGEARQPENSSSLRGTRLRSRTRTCRRTQHRWWFRFEAPSKGGFFQASRTEVF